MHGHAYGNHDQSSCEPYSDRSSGDGVSSPESSRSVTRADTAVPPPRPSSLCSVIALLAKLSGVVLRYEWEGHHEVIAHVRRYQEPEYSQGTPRITGQTDRRVQRPLHSHRLLRAPDGR